MEIGLLVSLQNPCTTEKMKFWCLIQANWYISMKNMSHSWVCIGLTENRPDLEGGFITVFWNNEILQPYLIPIPLLAIDTQGGCSPLLPPPPPRIFNNIRAKPHDFQTVNGANIQVKKHLGKRLQLPTQKCPVHLQYGEACAL